MLTLTRLDNVPDFHFAPLDLNRLLSDVRTNLLPTAQEKRIDVRCELNTTIPPILADQQELYRALSNLVDNAIHYTREGGSVTIRMYKHDEGVVVQVTDTGIGIPTNDLPHIFERFYRSEAATQVRSNGTGLGLAIFKRIVEVHGGKIELESALDVGTTFRVWLLLSVELHGKQGPHCRVS